VGLSGECKATLKKSMCSFPISGASGQTEVGSLLAVARSQRVYWARSKATIMASNLRVEEDYLTGTG
jgi:hypothetical protein